MIDEAAKLTLMSLKVFRYVYIKFRPTLLSFVERKHLVGDNLWEKFGLHPPTIPKSDFQPSTTKSDSIGYSTVKTG